jgi:hypothetical protein
MKVYNYAIFNTNNVEIDDNIYDVICGKHEFYIPKLQEKFIFSIRGKIVPFGECKFKDEKIANGSLFAGQFWEPIYLDSIVNEYSLLKYLTEKKLCPPVGDMIFIRKVFSDIGDYAILDKIGMFGYEMADVRELPMGNFDLDVVNQMLEDNIIQASPGAKNDLTNIERKNLINGYCVDVRRSFRPDLPFYNNFQFNGEKSNIYDDIRRVLNG